MQCGVDSMCKTELYDKNKKKDGWEKMEVA